jgi:autotransporter-associated beta strand protein
LAVIDDELYLLSKSDGMVRAIGAAHLVLDVAAGTATQAEAGYAALDWGLSLTKSGAGSVVLDAANGFTGPVIVTGGTLVVTRDGVLTPTSLAIAAGARLALPATERVGLAVTSLDLAAGGRLDLGGGVITIAAGGISATDLQAALRAGRAGGSWTGHDGIGSTATAGDREVGYLIAADGSATISYAAAGDIDLNGTVNVFDLVGVNAAGSYGTGRPSAWQTGDFDYDGATNVFDLVRVNTAGAYGRGEYLPPRSPAPAPVPEPGVGLPLIGCLLPLLGGRPLTSLSLRPIAGDRRCN